MCYVLKYEFKHLKDSWLKTYICIFENKSITNFLQSKLLRSNKVFLPLFYHLQKMLMATIAAECLSA